MPMTLCERELAEILEQSVETVETRNRGLFSQLTQGTTGIAIYGAGNLGRKTLDGMRTLGQEPLAVMDGNPARWGGELGGYKILSPEQGAAKFGGTAAIVIAVWSPGLSCRHEGIRSMLNKIGCQHVIPFIPLFWSAPQIFLPHFRLDVPHKVSLSKGDVKAAFGLLVDHVSRLTFLEQLQWEISPDLQPLDIHPDALRYSEFDLYCRIDDEVFVDCGAFDGDTIQSFLSHHGNSFGKIVGLEPDPINYGRLRAYVAMLPDDVRQRVVIRPLAAGLRQEILRFECAGIGSHAVKDGGVEVESRPLDEVLETETVTYIKMDIEGAEIDAINGARRIIQRDHPIVAACVYHRQEHLWEIPLLLHSIYPDYRFFLRRYGDEFGDVVCYAVPPHRVNPAALT